MGSLTKDMYVQNKQRIFTHSGDPITWLFSVRHLNCKNYIRRHLIKENFVHYWMAPEQQTKLSDIQKADSDPIGSTLHLMIWHYYTI